jgi:hypothetical protein
MSEYKPIMLFEELEPYLRDTFLSKMEARSPVWWAMQSAIERTETGPKIPPTHQEYDSQIHRMYREIADLKSEICVLKNAQETPST